MTTSRPLVALLVVVAVLLFVAPWTSVVSR